MADLDDDFDAWDPDRIYYIIPNMSVTFIYSPRSGKLYAEKNPMTHGEMLEDEECFRDVFGRDAPAQFRMTYGTRLQALAHGALLGRIGLKEDGTPIVALWDGDGNTHTNVVNLIHALQERLPRYRPYWSKAKLYIPGTNPLLVSDYTGEHYAATPTAQALPHNTRTERQYEINGVLYTVSDLQALRAAMHSRAHLRPGMPDPQSVLCHPDLLKYPEVKDYRPMSCDGIHTPLRPTHAANWRQMGRAVPWAGNRLGLAVHDYGEQLDFRSFFNASDCTK